jgi:hypothetical protein
MDFIRCTLNYKDVCHSFDEIDAAIDCVDNINNENKINPFSIVIKAKKKDQFYDYIFEDEEIALEALMNL